MILLPANYWKVMAGLLGATLGFAVLFLAVPEIDIVVSSWFYNEETGQFAGRSAFFLALREIINGAFNIIVLSLLGLWVVALWRGPTRALVPAWYWGFPLAAILLGPGLLVNVLLKGHWGRARPDAVFAGDANFTLPFVMTDQCDVNCSFVSGEASSLSTLAMLIAVMIAPSLGAVARKRLLWGCGALAAYGCFIRVFMGRHFISDTIFAVLFCAIVIWCIWGAMAIGQRQDEMKLVPAKIKSKMLNWNR